MRLFSSILRNLIKTGHLTIVDSRGRVHDFGNPAVAGPTMVFHDRATERAMLLNPQLALGEAYMDGRITVEGGDIATVLELFLSNMGAGFGGGYWSRLAAARRVLRPWMQRNSLRRAHKNVAHHYDLSGALYDLFLDSDRQYSCAFFESPTDSLEQAQAQKVRRVTAKLDLKPGQRVLDIGSGWGGLGLHMAQEQRVDVTGITLSQEQLKVANESAAAAGLSDSLRFRLEDYRRTQGPFDRIVSVGMFEHVGVPNYQAFFDRVSDLLAEDGVALLHAIGRVDGPGVTNPWFAKYIFPGGYTPALSEVLPAIERSGLIVTDVEILRLHYAYTLEAWRQRFRANRDKAAKLYDERFCRMWEFYLAAMESSFRHQGLMVFQIQMAKRIDALPLTRDYMMPKDEVADATPRRQAAFGGRKSAA